MRLEGKSAVITGGGSGIGFACARLFAREGAKVLIGDIDAGKGEEAALAIDGDEDVRAAGGGALFHHCDVGDKAEARALIDEAVAQFGGLDIAVANAAIIHTAEFIDLAEEDFDRVLRVNLKGAFLVGQAAARRMVAGHSGGAIINMSSVNAVMAIPNQVPYTVAKGGLNQLTRVMALALADAGIRVNAIGPGTILTDLAMVVMKDEEARRKILSRTPLGRCGEPDEIAAIALFLASDDASYITGQCIYADGGRLALNYTVPIEE
jgi:NAD(P)-dependent dehydrogenase (short-subunit alcohol dehydrogenase family)